MSEFLLSRFHMSSYSDWEPSSLQYRLIYALLATLSLVGVKAKQF